MNTPTESPENPVDIYVVGTGMVGYNQLTRETMSALEESERVYFAGTQDAVMAHFEAEYDTEVVDLRDEYTEGGSRLDTYERMAELVMEGAEELDAPVTFALYGHPMVFVSPSKFVLDEAPDRGLAVEVQPGISAMDCIYADVNFDPARNGVQMFEASDLLLREWELNPEVPTMIWQVGAVETAMYVKDWSEPERFTRFREYLQQFYPDDHEVRLLQTATYPLAESQQVTVPLDEFETKHELIDRGMYILYVPPVEKREFRNEELLEKFESREHVETLTREEP